MDEQTPIRRRIINQPGQSAEKTTQPPVISNPDLEYARAVENMEKALDNDERRPQKDPEQDILEYVNTQIEKMDRYSKLTGPEGMPGFYELNQALMNWESINNSLIAMEVLAKAEAFKATEAFEDWYSFEYGIMRDKLNPRTLAANKWYSQKEIDMQLRVEKHARYVELNNAARYAEMKVAYMRRLLDSWDGYKFSLNRICRNVEAEMTPMQDAAEM